MGNETFLGSAAATGAVFLATATVGVLTTAATGAEGGGTAAAFFLPATGLFDDTGGGVERNRVGLGVDESVGSVGTEMLPLKTEPKAKKGSPSRTRGAPSRALLEMTSYTPSPLATAPRLVNVEGSDLRTPTRIGRRTGAGSTAKGAITFRRKSLFACTNGRTPRSSATGY